MMIADDAVVAAVRVGASARQGGKRRAADEDVEPVVVEAHAEPKTDKARGDRVEHLAQPEPSRGGDSHRHVLVVAGAPVRKAPRVGTLALDPLGIAGIGAADDLVDEGSVGGQIGGSRTKHAAARHRLWTA